MPPITVHNTIRLALPPETVVMGGSSGLLHHITWVVTPRATAPALVNLRGGELVVGDLKVLQAVDDRLTLATLLERLAIVPIAALAIRGQIEDSDRQLANQLHIPLLQLPATADIREVEREVQRLLNDYDAQLERRGAQLATLLSQRALAGVGAQGLVDLLAERTGCGIGCFSASGDLRALRARGSARVALQTFQPSSAGLRTHLAQQIWVQPLGHGSDRLGFLVVCGDELDDWDRVAATQGSAAVALELTKEQAVLAAEERLRGDFLQTVLSGQHSDSETILNRGRDLGYELRQPHAALICGASTDDEGLAHRLAALLPQALSALELELPTLRRAEGILCFLPVLDRQGRSVQQLAEALRQRLVADMPVIVAIGREATSISQWQRSLHEAEQALVIGRELFDNARVFNFADLGVYRLLILLRDKPELWEFYRATLAALTDYDRDQRSELIKTLHAFFENLGNLTRTADALHVHRNTLLYRLERIQEISGMNLEDPDDRLALWIALKAHRVLHSLERV